jgi:hypothetical protein
MKLILILFLGLEWKLTYFSARLSTCGEDGHDPCLIHLGRIRRGSSPLSRFPGPNCLLPHSLGLLALEDWKEL